MTPDEFRKEIELKLIPVLQAEYGKRRIQFMYNRTRNDEYVFGIRVPRPMNNGMMTVEERNYTVWYVDDKLEWCEGILPQHPPKDIN